ncbi:MULTISPECIES: hypothetical protein [Bradyrhizobium]|uniref:hypothetical protein n=1 Tax=Bradyrhizobium TaxID=374 RepID=UPI0004217FF5|nr:MULTISPECIES: hypothetical protein [Bradyrhizobium]UFW50554.1 hypothetical protein BaraCB756_05750 [Bradyrhizobium arachidis]
MHFRLEAIRARLGVTFKELDDGCLHRMPLAGKDALLGVPDRSSISSRLLVRGVVADSEQHHAGSTRAELCG